MWLQGGTEAWPHIAYKVWTWGQKIFHPFVKSNQHYTHLYLTLLWTDCRCCWRFSFRVALWPHCVQIYWTPIWTDRTCCWRFVSELSCSHIAHKFIWLHCEQIAHVHVDFGFELPYTHNAHKYNYLGHNLIYPWIMVWNWLH